MISLHDPLVTAYKLRKTFIAKMSAYNTPGNGLNFFTVQLLF